MRCVMWCLGAVMPFVQALPRCLAESRQKVELVFVHVVYELVSLVGKAEPGCWTHYPGTGRVFCLVGKMTETRLETSMFLRCFCCVCSCFDGWSFCSLVPVWLLS